MTFKKHLVLASLFSVTAQASYLSITLDDQTAAPTKRPCKVEVTLSSDSSTVVETFSLTRHDELRTTELDKFNTIAIAGFIKRPALAAQACPNPEGTSRNPDFSASHKFDEQVYRIKIRLENNEQNLNMTDVWFIEDRRDEDPADF